MAHKFTNNIDLEKKEIQNAVAHNLPSAPPNPVAGQFYYDTTLNAGFEFNGTAWIPRGTTPTDAEIKTAYENNNNTNAFTDAEQTKLSGVEAGAQVNQTPAQIASAYESNANTNKFTDEERTKLASLEGSKFLGTYVSIGALNTAHPAPAEGSYADVDSGVGNDVTRWIWDSDDSSFVEQTAGVGGETAASVKTKYESNANTNAFTDDEQTKVANSTVKVATTITGDGTATSFPVTHNLGTRDVSVGLRETSTNEFLVPDFEANTTNQVTAFFGVAPGNGKEYRVIVIG